MSGIVTAAVGIGLTVVSTGITLYQQDQAADKINSIKPKKFVPVDVKKTQDQAFAADVSGYQVSDEDFKRRFPKLVEGREYAIQDANAQREGAAPEKVVTALRSAGLDADVSGNPFKQAKNLGMPILAKDQRDRTYFTRLLSQNPQRTAGLSGQDVTRIALANTNSQAVFNQGLFGSRMNTYASQAAQAAQTNSAAITGLAGTLALASKVYNNNRDAQDDPLNSRYYISGDKLNSLQGGG